MNLHAATSATPDGLRAAFSRAYDLAWNIGEVARDERPSMHPKIRPAFTGAIERIGENDFKKPDVLGILGDEIYPFSDWPLFAIADALNYCHEAAMCGGDGGGPGLRKTGIGSLADGIDRLHKALTAKLTVTNGRSKMAWHPRIQQEVELRLASQNVSGHWNASVTEDNRVLIWPSNNSLEALVVRQPAWFECTIIDNTVVHQTEADRFRVERALEISLELIKLQAQVAELNERQRTILLPYMG